ncbi:MAG: ATP-binding cassette domain-containing protein [Cytophagaceae bacterium]|jgi:ABC-2 type transport system ATP-binding protein|nr:ATP-binding cassette domain-containing protein [Cytophagaceae bacterium]
MPFLEARNIVKKFANHVALRDVSISVSANTIFGMLGPNGAGKTTLIRIINQITGPDSGEILFDGCPLKAEDVARIGYLPEERGLYKKMKVGEQALYLCQLKGLSRNDALKKLRFWFEKFEIGAWWDKKVEELSKGMQQKVQFITTVLHSPSLLIFDEPFSGFDPINANLLKEEILELRKGGATVIFSTHNMASVEELCDDIALINNGRAILTGTVKEIRQNFRQNIVRLDFYGDPQQFANTLSREHEIQELETLKEYNTAQIRLSPETSVNSLLTQVMGFCQIHGCQEVLPTMNDIFIRVVNENKKTV